VRVSFVTKTPSIRVTETPIAVPATLGRHGLSEVPEEHEEQRGQVHLDILINGKFLRSSLATYITRHAVSTEQVLELEYVPAVREPIEEGSDEQPDWVSCVVSGGERSSFFVCGSYDAAVRVYDGSCKVIASAKAHKLPVTCLAIIEHEPMLCVSGSKDETVRLWSVDPATEGLCALARGLGHAASVSASPFIAVITGTGTGPLETASGDWDGHVCLWHMSKGLEVADGPKRRKTDKGAAAALVEVTPEASFTAHGQTIGGLGWLGASLVSGSWDRSLKTWDAERQDCTKTINTAKPVTCLSTNERAGLVVTGHPDGKARVWDRRAEAESVHVAALAGHKQWITGVSWVPDSDHLLMSCCHGGEVKLWDIRSTTPLHSIKAHTDKALGICWHAGLLISVGADGGVKAFSQKDTR
ncbi:unnamed protein product, partial [Chrysoparadoxa australica]